VEKPTETVCHSQHSQNPPTQNGHRRI